MRVSALVFSAFIGVTGGTAFGAPIGWQPVTVGVPNSNSQPQGQYQNPYTSSSGNQYQYDLNKSTDRIRYENDYNAQIRDRYDPRNQIDRNQGQYGGGIYGR